MKIFSLSPSPPPPISEGRVLQSCNHIVHIVHSFYNPLSPPPLLSVLSLWSSVDIVRIYIIRFNGVWRGTLVTGQK